MNCAKLEEIVLDALSSRGYSDTEARKLLAQLILKSEEGVEEVLPGSGIFCSVAKQQQCTRCFRDRIIEYERLWRTWMKRCHSLLEYFQEALSPFNTKIKEVSLFDFKRKQ